MTDDELRGLFDEVRRHFDVTAERFETRLEWVAESALAGDERLARRLDVLERAIERAAADTHAMIAL